MEKFTPFSSLPSLFLSSRPFLCSLHHALPSSPFILALLNPATGIYKSAVTVSLGGAVAVWVASRPEACRLSQLQGCGFESAPLTSIA